MSADFAEATMVGKKLLPLVPEGLEVDRTAYRRWRATLHKGDPMPASWLRKSDDYVPIIDRISIKVWTVEELRELSSEQLSERLTKIVDECVNRHWQERRKDPQTAQNTPSELVYMLQDEIGKIASVLGTDQRPVNRYSSVEKR